MCIRDSVDTDLVEVITYTLNGKETTAPAGETITYTSNWIVVNGEGVQTDVIPEAGDVILTNQIKITEDTEVTFIASGEKYTCLLYTSSPSYCSCLGIIGN